jgi:nucleotide-binding universal stress UspA family protein
MIKRILVPYDGSAESRSAFNFALDWMKKYKADLYAIAVIELPQPPVDIETEAFLESSKSKYEKLFKDLHKEVSNVDFRHFVVTGKAANCIVEAAKEKNIDIIFIGHPTHTGPVRWFIGSTANHVIDHAECSVVVVKKEV